MNGWLNETDGGWQNSRKSCTNHLRFRKNEEKIEEKEREQEKQKGFIKSQIGM